MRSNGREWFEDVLLPQFAPVSMAALLATPVRHDVILGLTPAKPRAEFGAIPIRTTRGERLLRAARETVASHSHHSAQQAHIGGDRSARPTATSSVLT
jgi:hypothetical protein